MIVKSFMTCSPLKTIAELMCISGDVFAICKYQPDTWTHNRHVKALGYLFWWCSSQIMLSSISPLLLTCHSGSIGVCYNLFPDVAIEVFWTKEDWAARVRYSCSCHLPCLCHWTHGLPRRCCRWKSSYTACWHSYTNQAPTFWHSDPKHLF